MKVICTKSRQVLTEIIFILIDQFEPQLFQSNSERAPNLNNTWSCILNFMVPYNYVSSQLMPFTLFVDWLQSLKQFLF